MNDHLAPEMGAVKIGFSHFESDECAALNEWLKVAPRAAALCSIVAAMVRVNDFADRPARAPAIAGLARFIEATLRAQKGS